MAARSNLRELPLFQKTRSPNDGVCSTPEKGFASWYSRKYRKAVWFAFQVMLNKGGSNSSCPTSKRSHMRYPIVIERGDETHAYGVVVPDLPGCFSAGDTLDEAFEMAKEAIEGWIECVMDDGEEIPKPSTMEEISKMEEFQGWILGSVDVDFSKLSDKVERVNITLPARILRRLDAQAQKAGVSRSGYLSQLVMSV